MEKEGIEIFIKIWKNRKLTTKIRKSLQINNQEIMIILINDISA